MSKFRGKVKRVIHRLTGSAAIAHKLEEMEEELRDVKKILKNLPNPPVLQNMPAQNPYYKSCNTINNFYWIIGGGIHVAGESRVCCEPLKDRPKIEFGKTKEEFIRNVLNLRYGIIEESKNDLPLEKRIYSKGCLQCDKYQLKIWEERHTVHLVDLGVYPSPCNCKCIYCPVHSSKECTDMSQPGTDDGYKKLFDTLNYAKNIGLIDKDTIWNLATGDPSVHPYRNQFMDLIGNNSAQFTTNCIVFEKRIGKNLAANPASYILTSIDCGTRETWFKIKGLDNFDKVIESVKKYRACASEAKQIIFKYIVLPGINDTVEEYLALIDLMKNLDITLIQITQDNRKKYNSSPEYVAQIEKGVGLLIAMLRKNGIFIRAIGEITQTQINNAMAYADELLESGKV
jgi:hypothetical protein